MAGSVSSPELPRAARAAGWNGARFAGTAPYGVLFRRPGPAGSWVVVPDDEPAVIPAGRSAGAPPGCRRDSPDSRAAMLRRPVVAGAAEATTGRRSMAARLRSEEQTSELQSP